MPILLILVSALPVLALLFYFDRQDKGKKEPRKLKREVFVAGFFATILAIFIELPVDWIIQNIAPIPILYFFLSSFITAALVEEGIKLWVVKNKVYKLKAFDEVMDGITYAILVSMGFALFENIFYVLEGGLFIGAVRAVTAVPAHAMFSGIMGYYIGKSKKAQLPEEGKHLIYKGLAIAILYHGLYNFLLSTASILSLLVVPLLIIMGIHLSRKINQARFEDKVKGQLLPEKITAWRIFKTIIALIFILVAALGLLGIIFIVSDPAYTFTITEISISAGFSVFLGFLSYLLLRKN